ncbi:MAG: radical SAM protein [Phycisphaerae bacterium]
MRIGMIAMSGVRACSEELNRIGLSLPGVVERGRIVASMPSLSLLTLAALTPPEFEIEYREIEDLRTQPALPEGYDLVAIATFSAQACDAYAVADHYRARGVATVMGGLHVTAQPDEALQHCSAIVVGEAEALWPKLLADFRSGRLQRVYRAPPGDEFDLANAPIPRYELLDIGRYNRLTVQTSRGCPYVCDFCASSILLTSRYKVKPVETVMAEIRRIKELWPQPFIEFADDNSFANKAHYRRLLEALRHEGIRWFTECDISIARDPELIDLMREAGCRQVLIGLESPTSRGLDGVETRGNWKLRQFPHYLQDVREIQSHGVTVNGCFVLGLDGDDESVFDSVYEFAEKAGLFEIQITVLTPFPGTPLYDRLLHEGRLITPGAWSKCTLFDVNFVPRGMSPERLQQGLVDLARRLYDPEFVRRRRETYFANVRPRL